MDSMVPRTLKVLLVDDDEDEYLLTRPLVEDMHHLSLELSWVTDREAMLAHLAQEQVDVVLMDYHLGEDNGVALIDELTATGSEVPCVLLTGAGTRAIDLAAMSGGAVDYLDKDGLTSVLLERTIRYAVEGSRLKKQEREANRFYRSLVEHIPAAFFISEAGSYASKSYVSPQMETLLDTAAVEDSDTIATPWLDRIHADDRQALTEQIRRCDLTGSPASISYRLNRRDGSFIWVHEEAVLVYSATGDPVHWHGVIYDISSQKLIEAQLHENEDALILSNLALERSNRALQEFVYVASHDLKAPLVSIMGMATMLHKDYGVRLEGDGLIFLDRIIGNAVKLRKLLEDILELSLVGHEEVESSDVDLNGLVADVTEQLRYQLDERGAQVTVDGTLPTVFANQVHLQRVLSNLIDNAVQYTPVSRLPQVTISARNVHDFWELAVSDNGSGIAVELHDKAFVMLQRLPNGKSLNPNGTGMGLAIVARIIELNGGRCWIASSNDEGTKMCMTIPKQAA